MKTFIQHRYENGRLIPQEITYYTRSGASKNRTNCHKVVDPNGVVGFYSYSTLIGFKVDGVVYERGDKFSCTTSKHRSILSKYAYDAQRVECGIDRESWWDILVSKDIHNSLNYYGSYFDIRPKKYENTNREG